MSKELTDKEKEVFDAIIDQPVSIVSVADGWVFKFSEEALEELLEKAQDKGGAIVFLKRPQGN